MWNRILDELYEWTKSILFLGSFMAVVSAVFMFITSF